MILAGDLGGTKTNLALFEFQNGKLHCAKKRRFASKDYARVEDLIAEFGRPDAGKLWAAGFAVAAPVLGQRVKFTNLPWVLEGPAIAEMLGLPRVVLLNDMEATGYSVASLEPQELFTLSEGKPAPHGTQALIAAGTGLGEAILWCNGTRRIVLATEGGHRDFAPRNDEEIELLRFLKKKFRHVSFEHVVSGGGFRLIHEFFDPALHHPGLESPAAEAAPEITRRGLKGTCPVCVRTLNLWVSLYGAEAANLALKSLAVGGVFLAGGIAVKLLDKLKEGTFVRAFSDKSKFGGLLGKIPIHVVLNEEAPLLAGC